MRRTNRLTCLVAGSIGVVVLVAAMALLRTDGVHASAPAMKLTMAGIHPEKSLITAALYKKFLQLVSEKTQGRISFNAYWAASLVRAPELLDAASKGIVDVANGFWIFEPGRVPLGALSLNFLFNKPDLRTQAKIQREIYDRIPAMNMELAAVNLGPALFFGPLPSYDILSKRPIRTVADLKGLRIGHSPTEYVPAFEAVGAVSVISPAPQFYERLERGVIDAIFLPVTISDIYKIYEVARHHTTVGFNTPVIFTLWINRGTWNRLTPADQKIFREAGVEVEDHFVAQLAQDVERIKKSWADKGVKFHTMPEAEIKRWAELMPDVAARWAERMEAQGKPGREIVKLYRELGGTRR